MTEREQRKRGRERMRVIEKKIEREEDRERKYGME